LYGYRNATMVKMAFLAKILYFRSEKQFPTG